MMNIDTLQNNNSNNISMPMTSSNEIHINIDRLNILTNDENFNQESKQSQAIPSTQQTEQTEEIISELPKENAISKGSVGNIKESAVNRKIPTSLQRDVYKQIVRKFLLCTI